MTRRTRTGTVTPRPFPEDSTAGDTAGNKVHTAPMRTRKGEPVVTAIWMTASIATLVLGVAFPCLGAFGSPLQRYVVPTVALLYGTAILGTCIYNRLRYGRVYPNPLPARRTHAQPARDIHEHADREHAGGERANPYRRARTTSRASG